ncbi:MAG: hypothetical protein Kow0068_23690 [Marinilabiliales bacterium]
MKKALFNNYTNNTKGVEILLKEINHFFESIYLFFINGFKIKRVLTYPELPRKRTSFYKLCKRMNLAITNKPRKKILFAAQWEDITIRERAEVLEKLATKKTVLNINCRDISKTVIDKKFEECFGYCTRVDPTKHKGKCLKKNELNAQHDGVEVMCPIDKPEPGYIYQIIINNFINNDFVYDIRVPVIKECLNFVYIKEKKKGVRYESNLFRSKLVDIKEILSDEEIQNLNKFCKHINLDYGELDVLRNNDDNKIYVIDVNYTAFGPAQKLSKEKKEYALSEMEKQFKRHFPFD